MAAPAESTDATVNALPVSHLPNADTNDQAGSNGITAMPTNLEQGEDHSLHGIPEVSPKKKKKKSRKPASKRGLDKPTGFEEYYVDTPLTPAEHAEEQQVYDPILPFIDRILTAIQRFERTRKLNPERRHVFMKYLAYGSIDIGPNMFNSVSATDPFAEQLDKDQLAAAMSRTSISADKKDIGSDTSMYAVDFTGCVAGFLSRRASEWFGMETKEQVLLVTTTLERFMSYLLQHDVCPEYNADVLSARDTCRLAAKELWAVAEAQRWLPGDFNIACSTLFGGQYARDYDGVTNWGPGMEGKSTFVGFTQEIANQVMSFGVAGAADEDVYQDFLSRTQDNSFKIIEIRERAGFEITKIEGPSQDCRDLYKTQSEDFRPVGRIHAKAWTNPDSPPEDLTPEERKAFHQQLTSGAPARNTSSLHEYIFLVEEVIQQHLFVGMKLEATVRRLNCGVWFFDEFSRGYCSFDTWLCNEMLVGWKEPRAVPGALDYKPEQEVEEVEMAQGWAGVSGETLEGVGDLESRQDEEMQRMKEGESRDFEL